MTPHFEESPLPPLDNDVLVLARLHRAHTRIRYPAQSLASSCFRDHAKIEMSDSLKKTGVDFVNEEAEKGPSQQLPGQGQGKFANGDSCRQSMAWSELARFSPWQ